MPEFLTYFLISLGVLILLYIGFSYVNLKKQQRRFVEIQQQLKVNTEVVISGGIYGRIKHLEERYAKVEIADGVVIKVERYAIKGAA